MDTPEEGEGQEQGGGGCAGGRRGGGERYAHQVLRRILPNLLLFRTN